MEGRSQMGISHKLSFTYTCVVVVIVAVLTLYSISSFRRRAEEAGIKENRRMIQAASDYLTEAAAISSYIQGELYRSGGELSDLCRFLTEDPESYQKYRLDTYSNSSSLVYSDTQSFLERTFEAYADIRRIELVSYERELMAEAYPNGSFWPGIRGERLDHILQNAIEDRGEFSFRREIRDVESGVPVGCLIFVFDASPLEEIRKAGDQSSFFVLNLAGNLVWGDLPCDREVILNAQGSDALERATHSFAEKESASDFVVYALLDKSAARELPASRILLICAVGIGLVAAGRMLVNWYLRRLNRRLEVIIFGMNRVTGGELDIHLPVNARGDELDVISFHFNRMCGELDAYIRKSYLAEIERKNAEMQALQSQMNPHFLYNTLEAIRMKAICNGDREVGKMLYSMAVTFRAQIKEKDVITLAQELHYCKNYLVLFEYRYKNRFKVRVDCDCELLQLPVIKFLLQPVIENYFVHGIRLEDTDNELHIWAERKGDRLILHAKDNGKGMDAAKMRQVNDDLLHNHYEVRSSIGISNVNRRIRAVYGDGYGVRLEAGEERGVHVILEICAQQPEEEEE